MVGYSVTEPLPPFTVKEADLFWSKVDRRGPDECWPWLGYRRKAGYGRLRRGGRLCLATHVALEFAGRPLVAGQMALHRCDNPPCVNPAHLFAGTQSDNMRDMLAKGRQGRLDRTSPLYRRHLSEGIKAYWQGTSLEQRRALGQRMAKRNTPTVRCGAPLAQSDGGCFRTPGHRDCHRSEAGILRRRQCRTGAA